MNAKTFLPLLTSLLVMPVSLSAVLLLTARAEAQVTVAQTDAAALLEEGDRLLQQGIQQLQVSQFQEALQSWQQALDLYRDPAVQAAFPKESRQGEGFTLMGLGFAYSNLGQYERAIEFHEQHLAIARELGDSPEERLRQRIGEVRALSNLGMAYSNLDQYERAIEFHEQHLAIARELSDRAEEGRALGSLGNNYLSLRQYERVIDFSGQHLIIARDLGDRAGEIRALVTLGTAYWSLGQYQQAIDYYEQRLMIAREFGDSPEERLRQRVEEGETLDILALAYWSLDQYQQAIDYYEQRLIIARELGDRDGEGRALANLGQAYQSLSQYQQAIDSHEQALAIALEIGDRSGEGLALGSLGDAYNSLGQYQQAINHYEQFLTIALEIGDRRGEGNALGSLGRAYENLGQYQQAIGYFERSLAIAREVGNRQGEGASLGNLGHAYYGMSQYQQAIDYYEQFLTIARALGDRREEGSALGSLGVIYRNLGQYPQAIDFYEQFLTISRELGDRKGEGIALGNLGNVYADLDQYQEAIALYEQHLVIAREIGDRAGEGNVLNNLGIAHLSLERYPQATETLFAAIEVYESLRDGDIPDAQQITFFDTQSSAYGFLQRSLIAQGETEQALAISERGRARAFVSSLAERQNQDAPALPPPSIADIQRTAQAQNATLVQYSRASFEDGVSQLYIWVIQPTGEITFRSVDLSGLDSSLFEFITTSRDAIGLRSRNNDATIEVALTPEALRTRAERQRQILQELHTLLIDPIADLLPADPDAPVIIIPHQELFLVPFAALVDANGDYLIQHHTLLTAPSIQVLQLLGEQQATTATGDPLIIGNPIMPSIWNPATGEDENLSSLPGAEAEAIAIAEVFNTEPLLWEQASETTVTRRMATAPLLHFATHGLLDYGDPTATGVRDFPGAIALAAGEGNDGLLTSAEIFDLTLSAELVVLSACDTGRGRITGDGVIGLSRAFIQAGVPQVLVSLWAVPDAPTAELMTTFYQQRDLTDTDAQALRQAMLITLQTHPNPRDWAAFTLIGGAQ
ncbi:tetratricopeptide repeat protein [Leptolyngbya sp. CCY15150]|uniref:CHAT domain-containing tetratricopeptide repeat protein n=1 Tax=Leptolyngbya sp. CCY15150 TaxID=2767772 RepID=UPI001951C2C9|nr:tetratricopeptide repeat protein [Leptolyngbya sp. CCY15150]